MRKHTIDPCSMKGETWSFKKSGGGSEPVTRPVYWTPCECMQRWTSVRPASLGSFSYGIERDVTNGDADTQAAISLMDSLTRTFAPPHFGPDSTRAAKRYGRVGKAVVT